MTYKFIAEKDFDSKPSNYVKYLKETARCAQATLDKAEVQWPKGTSHEISRAILNECNEAYQDIVLEYGLFSAEGQLVDFADN